MKIVELLLWFVAQFSVCSCLCCVADRCCCLLSYCSVAVAFQRVCGNALDISHAFRIKSNVVYVWVSTCVCGWVAEGVDTNRIKVVTVCVVCYYSLTVIILFCACFQSKLIYVCFQLYLSTYGLMDWWMIWLALLSAKSTKQYKPV